MDTYSELMTSENGGRRIDSWLLMSSPWPVLTIAGLYLYFVLKLGPQMMAKRQAFQLKRVLLFYNLYQVLFSLWITLYALNEGAITSVLSHGCKPLDKSYHVLREKIEGGVWWYFFAKVVELLDTVFFVLRKKQSQVTFLHVYHHTMTMLVSWTYLKYLPGEQIIPLGVMNSIVHVVMYFYYLMSAMGPEYQKFLWWKKYMTWMQLIQFILMLAYISVLATSDCNFPKGLAVFYFSNVLLFLYLFSAFYRQAYRKKV